MRKQFALIAIIVCVCIISITVFAIEPTTISEANIPSESPSQEEDIIKLEVSVVERVKTTDMDILNQLLNECADRMHNANQMYAAALALGYGETHPVAVLAQQEWAAANADYEYYSNIISELQRKAEEKWIAKMKKYPTASYVWQYMKNLGWSDYVCAGIMGNLMTETGGQTLKLQPTLVYQGHYGICQWSKTYYPNVWGKDLDTQLDFLKNTIKIQMNKYGHLYKKGFNYKEFLKLTDVRAVADAFAVCYERPGTSTLRRQNHAETAYKFFVD